MGEAAAWIIAGLLLIIFTFGGWLNNINYIIDSDFTEVSGREVISVIGVFFPPIGAINGDIYFFENEKSE